MSRGVFDHEPSEQSIEMMTVVSGGKIVSFRVEVEIEEAA